MPRKTHATRLAADVGLRASMRPRPDAAENRGMLIAVAAARLVASMRPRPDAAENRCGTPASRARAGRFNEAAARCRGKPTAAFEAALQAIRLQ